jgi:WD40 repeat protein
MTIGTDHGRLAAFRLGVCLLALLIPSGRAQWGTRAAAPPPGRPTPFHLCVNHRREAILELRFAPSGKLLVSTRDEALTVWDVETGRPVLDMDLPIVKTMAFSPDGRLLAVGRTNEEKAGSPGEVHVYDLTTMRRVAFLDGAMHGPDSLAFSPDGRLLVGQDRNRQLIVWDLKRQVVQHRPRPRPRELMGRGSLLLSPDGTRLSISYTTAEDGGIEILDSRTDAQIPVLKTPAGHHEPVWFSENGGGISFIENDGRIMTGSLATGRRTSSSRLRLPDAFSTHARENAFGPGLRLVATTEEAGVELSDTRTGKVLWSVAARDPSERRPAYSLASFTVSISPDGRWLASSLRDFAVEIWDLQAVLGKDHSRYTEQKKP